MQGKEIERLHNSVELERSQHKLEVKSLREQIEHNSLTMIERIVGEQVYETEQRVRKEFEN